MARQSAVNRSQANRSSQQGLPPPSPTAGTWAGALGWQVTNSNISGIKQAAYWNAHMASGDFANVTLTQSFLVASMNIGSRYAAVQLSNASDQVTNANLATIDTNYQNAFGLASNYVIYGDDQFSIGTTASRIAIMASHVGFIRGYARANGAAAFKVIYIPSGNFLQANIAANPTIASLPDGILFQTQPFEDTSVGADPTYINTVATCIAACKAAASPGNAVAAQVQTYSKSNKTTVWSSTKMIQDIDAVGAACNPTWIQIWFADSAAQATSTSCFVTVLSHYRP